MYTAMRKGVKTHHLICEQITAHAATGELLVIASIILAVRSFTARCHFNNAMRWHVIAFREAVGDGDSCVKATKFYDVSGQ